MDYTYTGMSPSAAFTLTPFTINPIECQSYITYSCSNTGPRTDMCSVVVQDSEGIFDSETGGYEFYTVDKVTFPIGVYTFTITGTLNGL